MILMLLDWKEQTENQKVWYDFLHVGLLQPGYAPNKKAPLIQSWLALCASISSEISITSSCLHIFIGADSLFLTAESSALLSIPPLYHTLLW